MTARPLLLLHGALGSASQFAELSDRLRAVSSDGVAVLTLDFEGHGAAPMLERPFRTRTFAENVIALLDRERLERVSIFGYSMGGYVALALAAGHSARVEHVMTLGTKFRWTPEIAARESRMLDPHRIEEKVPHFARALDERHAAVGWQRVLERTAEMMHALGARPDLDDGLLGGIACPVRICVGDRDATVAVEESADVARVIPGGELEVLPGTPHPFEKVSADRLTRSLLEFVQLRGGEPPVP